MQKMYARLADTESFRSKRAIGHVLTPLRFIFASRITSIKWTPAILCANLVISNQMLVYRRQMLVLVRANLTFVLEP